jgi:hypothetical protein
MAKFTWQDGTLVSKAKVEIGGTIYEVDPEEYSGATPLSASNLNAMQDGIYEDINENAEELDNLIKITEMGTISSSEMTTTTIGGHNGKRYDLTFTKQYSTPPMVITNIYHDANYGSYGIAPATAINITTTGCRLLLEADVSLSNYGVKYIVISND